MNTRYIITIVLAVCFILSGCSGGDPISPTDTTAGSLNGMSNPLSSDARMLWGMWEIGIDPATGTTSVLPLRFASFHANVRQLLEESPCKGCLQVVPPITPTPEGMNIDIALIHPFIGDSYYTGFDVRGIVMLEGDYLFPYLGLTSTRAAAGGWALLNPDGWTDIFNAQKYTQPGILGYSHGMMIPPTWPDPPNTLNAFKAYCSEGQSEDEGGRRAFINGDQVTRTFELQMEAGEPFFFWYAVDASWVPPAGGPPYEPDDFPPDANCPEVYRIDLSVVSGELFPAGGMVTIGLDAWNHKGWNEPGGFEIEAPECFDGGMGFIFPPIYQSGDLGHWEFDVVCEKSGLDPDLGAEVIVATHGEDPNLGTVGAFGRITVPISQAGPDPVVISINPDNGNQGESLTGVEVHGSNFIFGCTARLEKSGEPDVDASNVQFIDSENLTCDLDITFAASGHWDLVVENPGGATGTLADGFLVNTIYCNDVLHHNYLGIGDYSFGTNMSALDGAFVHDTGSLADGEFMIYISGFAGTVCSTYIVDTTEPEEGHGFTGGGWGNPYIGTWPTPISIDISEEMGRFFIVWSGHETDVEEWTYGDGQLNVTDASNTGTVKGLDTDGSGGWWNAYFPQAGFAESIKHFVPNASMTFSEVPEDHISMPEAWGSIVEVVCIPDDTLLILSGFLKGKIRAYDISVSPPVIKDEISGFFSGDLDFGTWPDKPCDMDADWSDPDLAHCRIIIWGNLQSGGGELVKIDTDLNILAGPISVPTEHFNSMTINPDVGHVTLWPQREGSTGAYALIELPDGW